jgi:hypothetical protein
MLRVGARVAAFEMDLVWPHAVELDEEIGIERESAMRASASVRLFSLATGKRKLV